MKVIKYIGIGFLFIFSFIYTAKIANVIKNKDPIMNNIIKKEESYRIDSVNAVIKGDTITPGINGCTIDINKSYKNMKKINEYTDKMLKYKDIIPEITLNNIYNKYVVSGNPKKRQVAIVINIIKSVEEINKYKSNKLNIFIDSSLLENGKIDISENINVYNGGVNNNYDDISIEWMNDVINDSYNSSSYCINKNRNDDNLLICARNKMHSITPSIIVNKNIYDVKSSINNGDIIYTEEDNIDKLNNIISYLNSKGIDIVYLDELLNYNMCEK